MSESRSARHRAQAGTTLVELLVATVIMGTALVLLVGLFSTGVVQSNLTKQETAAQAALQYEVDKVAASPYSAGAGGYSECFASDGSISPTVVAFQGICPGSARTRADVSPSQIQVNLQQWTIQINNWPAPGPVGKPVSVYKVDR